jgi:N-glycosylase/DNA lyase
MKGSKNQINQKVWVVADYDLEATLSSGQSFRWVHFRGAWEGVVDRHWLRLHQTERGIIGERWGQKPEWAAVETYLRLDDDYPAILSTFPPDPPLQTAVRACRGLRLLRQPPWECLAGFLCSSTKQIVQIQQIMAALCERYGDLVELPDEPSGRDIDTDRSRSEPSRISRAFPCPERIAALKESDLRACKLGFRAPNVLEAARRVADGRLDLVALKAVSLDEARAVLMQLPGIGPKIADCVLLYAYGFPKAFPVDVWVARALQELYFPERPNMKLPELLSFSERHFGPQAGYAQQFLFHYIRVVRDRRNAGLLQ